MAPFWQFGALPGTGEGSNQDDTRSKWSVVAGLVCVPMNPQYRLIGALIQTTI
jgi:hypothetical protein